jgi:hypothetical protein
VNLWDPRASSNGEATFDRYFMWQRLACLLVMTLGEQSETILGVSDVHPNSRVCLMHHVRHREVKRDRRAEPGARGDELTIRRDIEHLDAEGIVRRVYGGAVLNAGRSFERPFAMRLNSNVEGKKAIASAVGDLIPRCANVAIDFGTKAYYIALEMRRRHLQVLAAPTSVQLAESRHLGAQTFRSALSDIHEGRSYEHGTER